MSGRIGHSEMELAYAPSTSPVYLEPIENRPEPSTTGTGLLEYLDLFRERKLLIVALSMVGALAGLLVNYFLTPEYEAATSIEVVAVQPRTSFSNTGGDLSGYDPMSYMRTQVKVLESSSLRRRVIRKIHEQHPSANYPVPNRLADLRDLVLGPKPRPTKLPLPPIETRVRLAGDSRLIELVVKSPNAQYAALFANKMTEEYIESNMEANWESSQRTSLWLTRQLEEMGKKLQASERALQDYRLTSGLLVTNDQFGLEADRLKNVQSELSRATAERVNRQSTFEVAVKVSPDSVPQIIDNTRLNEYQTKLSELRLTLADLTALYTPEHYKVARVQAQIKDLEATLKQEQNNILRRLKNDLDTAERRETLLNSVNRDQMKRLSEHAQKEIRYNILKQEADSNRKIFDDLMHSVKEAAVASALQTSNVRVLDPALIPSAPVSPKQSRDVLAGLVSGLVLALGGLFVRQLVDRNLSQPAQVSMHVKVPMLGVIPSREAAMLPTPRLLLGYETEASGKVPMETATFDDERSLIAESFRSAVASIMAIKGKRGRPQVILLTSFSRGEGKTTVASNLSIALAEIGQKVLLVDADMRKPRLHQVFDVPNTWGLSDLLRDGLPLTMVPDESLCRPTKVAGLSILPSGPSPGSIASLLYSGRLGALLTHARQAFDLVIIDTPPMSHLADARILGQQADGVILVVRAGVTTRDSAVAATRRFSEDGIQVFGTILNGWDMNSKGARYGADAYYYGNLENVDQR